MSPAASRGFSEAYGSWKMICRCRRCCRICACESASSSSPSSFTDPDVGCTSRSTDFAVVVLPHPDSPTSDSVSPRPTSKETPSTAWIGGRGGANHGRGAR
jgi:hypothetical protein